MYHVCYVVWPKSPRLEHSWEAIHPLLDVPADNVKVVVPMVEKHLDLLLYILSRMFMSVSYAPVWLEED